MLNTILTAIARYFESCSGNFIAEGQAAPGAGYNAASPEPSIEIPSLYRNGAARSPG